MVHGCNFDGSQMVTQCLTTDTPYNILKDITLMNDKNNEGISLDQYRLYSVPERKVSSVKQKEKKSQNKGEFLASIPLNWLLPILELDRRAIICGSVIWHLYNLNRKKNEFNFSYLTAKKFCLSKSSARRGIKDLINLGAIKLIKQKQGSSPTISVVLNYENLTKNKKRD